MRFALLGLRVGVNLFIKCWVKIGTMWLWFNGGARSGGEFSLVMYLKSGGQTWGEQRHMALPDADYYAGAGQVPHKCDKWILNAAARQRTRPSILAALGTVRGFQP